MIPPGGKSKAYYKLSQPTAIPANNRPYYFMCLVRLSLRAWQAQKGERDGGGGAGGGAAEGKNEGERML